MLSTYLRPHRLRAILLAALLFSSIGLQLVNPQIMRFFIDTAQSTGSLRTLSVAAPAFLGVAVATQVVGVAEGYVAGQLAWLATNALRVDLAAHLVRLDLSFHHTHTPGELIQRVDGDVAILANFLSRFVISVLGNALLLLGVLILLFHEDVRIGLALTTFVLVALAVLNRVRTIPGPYYHAAREANADLDGFLLERLSGTEDICANGTTPYVLRRLYEVLRRQLRTEVPAMLAGTGLGQTAILLFAVGNVIAFALGACLLRTGAITIGTIYLIFAYTQSLLGPVQQLTEQGRDLQGVGASLSRIGELSATQSAVQDGPGAALPAGPLAVELDDASFAYTAGNTVLHHISFRLEPGRVLGVLGRTGSGKTTLTRLLFRFYDPTGGAIRLGGIDLRQPRLADLRTRIGLVTQDVQLFQATVRDNLTLFDQSVSDTRILDTLRDLGLWDWYQSQPEGLDTELADGGAALSAGEAQLVAFARVFLQDPGLIILDEATSRLDPATEQRIERALDSLLRGRTGIIVAHRLATVQRADEILILEDGHVREQGPRERLAVDPSSRFSELSAISDQVSAGSPL